MLALVVTGGGSQVVAAGRFDTLNGEKATGVGALDAVTGATRPFAINQKLTNQGVNSAVYSLTTDGPRVYGTAYDYYGPGNLEGNFVVTADGGAIIAVNDCRGDTYSSFPLDGALYVASHAHDCANIGGFPEQNPRVHKFATAYTTTATRLVGSRTKANSNFRGSPAGSLLPWFPTMTPGTFTGQSQAGWTVTGTSEYVVYGGEFPRVNGVGQQGLVRYAVPSLAPNRVGPAASAGLTPAAAAVAPGMARVSWTATSDPDNENLTYRVYRDADGTTPVYEAVQASTWWRTRSMAFTDAGLSGGWHQYRVTATDPFGNVVTSARVDVQVAAGGDGTRPYADAVRADGARSHWSLGESSRDTAYDRTGTADLTVGQRVTVGQTGALAGDPDPAYGFNGGSAALLATQTAAPAPNTFTVEAWFRTTSPRGGKILGYGSSRSGSSSAYDRHLYMDASGRVHFGVWAAARGSSPAAPVSTTADGTTWRRR